MEIKYEKTLMYQIINGVKEYTEIYIPTLDGEEAKPIGIWGRRHLSFLMEHKQETLDELIDDEVLNEYLRDIDRQASEMLDRLTEEMKKRENVTEDLKARNQMAWVQAMESIRNRVEEIVCTDLIYA